MSLTRSDVADQQRAGCQRFQQGHQVGQVLERFLAGRVAEPSATAQGWTGHPRDERPNPTPSPPSLAGCATASDVSPGRPRAPGLQEHRRSEPHVRDRRPRRPYVSPAGHGRGGDAPGADPASRAQRRHGRGALPHPRVGAARHRCALRRQGQPAPVLLAALAGTGSRFDVAGPAEVAARPEAGAVPRATSCTPTPCSTRRPRPRLRPRRAAFVVDTPVRWRKLAAVAPGPLGPGAVVHLRAGSDWPLSGKFGCSARRGRARCSSRRPRAASPRRGVLPRGHPAARPPTLGAAVAQAARLFGRLRPPGTTRGCSTSAAGLPATSRADIRPVARLRPGPRRPAHGGSAPTAPAAARRARARHRRRRGHAATPASSA